MPHIFVIPLRLEKTDVPASLADFQWADYFSPDKEAGYERLLLALTQRAAALGISTAPSKR